MPDHYSTQLLALEQLRDEVRRFFEDVDASGVFATASGWVPLVDVCETDDAVVVRAEVPGVLPGDVVASIVGQHLKISGRKSADEVDGTTGRLCLERARGAFCRVVRLDAAVDAGGSIAHLRDGVLTVRVPKRTDRRQTEIFVPIATDSEAP